MNEIEWVAWGLGIVLGVLGGWGVSAAQSRKLRAELQESRSQYRALLTLLQITQRGVTRIEQGEVLKAGGVDDLRPTVELAVSAALSTIIRGASNSVAAQKVQSILEEAAPKLWAQWKSLTPSEPDRLKLIAEMLAVWKDTVKARAAAGRHGVRLGGVQLGPSLWIPAYVVASIENADPLSFEARLRGNGGTQ